MILFGCLSILLAGVISYRNYELNIHGEEFCADVVTQFQNLVQVEIKDDVDYDSIYHDISDGLFGLTQFIDDYEIGSVVEQTVPEVVVKNEGININGDLYIGLLNVPQLGLTVPIHMDLTLKKLDSAPCVYLGNLAENDLILAGHNYAAHFGNLYRLNVGAKVSITDPNGQVYSYTLAEKSSISQYQVEQVLDRDKWDLTIFTCEYPNHNNRILFRFLRDY